MKTEIEILKPYEWTDNFGINYYREKDVIIAMREYAAQFQPPAPARSAEDILKKHIPNGAVNLKSYAEEREKMIAAMEEYRQQGQPVTGIRWRKSNDLPPIDRSEYPVEYLVRFYGDDPRSGANASGSYTAETMLEKDFGVNWNRWEWLDESGAASQPTVVASFIPCGEDDPDQCGDLVGKDGNYKCCLKPANPAFPTEEQIREAAVAFAKDQMAYPEYADKESMARLANAFFKGYKHCASQLSNNQNKAQ